jgi:hypothetical protein
MSYETAKEALRKNLEVMMSHKDTVTAQDHLLYSIAKSLFDLIGALEADLSELRDRLKEYDSRRPPR